MLCDLSLNCLAIDLTDFSKFFQTCDFDVYWFSFAVILLGWLAVCLAVAYIINKYGRELLNCVTCNKYAY